MDAELSEQIASTMDALRLSHTRAELVTQKMRKLGVPFGSKYDYADGDSKRIIGAPRYMKGLAEHQERVGG